MHVDNEQGAVFFPAGNPVESALRLDPVKFSVRYIELHLLPPAMSVRHSGRAMLRRQALLAIVHQAHSPKIGKDKIFWNFFSFCHGHLAFTCIWLSCVPKNLAAKTCGSTSPMWYAHRILKQTGWHVIIP